MRAPSPLRSLLAVASLLLTASAWSAACSATGPTSGFDEDDGPGNSGGKPGGSSSGDIGFDGGSSGSGTFGDANCGASTYANAVPASVLVVLDKSGSMSGGDGQPNKWPPTVNALNAMMNGSSQDLQMGLLPFPAGKFMLNPFCAFSPNDPACVAMFEDGGCTDVDPAPVVAVGPLSMTKQPISSWLASNSPDGGTPTLYALKTGYGIMKGLNVQGDRYVLLITDGEPNTVGPSPFGGQANVQCGTLPDIEAEALAASSGSPAVKTFVIGSPGSEGAGSFLSQIAINGLTQRSPGCTAAAANCHYQIGTGNFEADLQAALAEIAGAVSDCVFAIPEGSSEVDKDLVNLVIETSNGPLQTAKDASHMDGWDYTDPSKTKIQLFGPSCDAFKAEKGAKASIILGCKTIVK